MSRQNIEKQSLQLGQASNTFMSISVIVAGLMSGADAPLLDGLFSGINVISTMIAAQVGQNIHRPQSLDRPFGYYADEAIYK